MQPSNSYPRLFSVHTLHGDAHRRRETRQEKKPGREKEEGKTDVNGKKEVGKELEEQ